MSRCAHDLGMQDGLDGGGLNDLAGAGAIDNTAFDLRTDSEWRAFQQQVALWRQKGLKLRVSVDPYENPRTIPQNSRYWGILRGCLKRIQIEIEILSDETGYTVLEIKRLIAIELDHEQSRILFAQDPEEAHKTLKHICGVPTTQDLGTKKFSVFEERMEQVITEIAGVVIAFSDRALA